jgi:hypothetical protein
MTTLKLRREDVSPEHFQVYSGEVRIGFSAADAWGMALL